MTIRMQFYHWIGKNPDPIGEDTIIQDCVHVTHDCQLRQDRLIGTGKKERMQEIRSRWSHTVCV